MARFDVRSNLNRASREQVPYLVELQADLLSGLATRFVAPLVPASRFGTPAARLNPVFRIGARNFVMDTALCAAIPSKQLGERITSLSPRAPDVLAAIDLLISGI